MIVRTVLAVTLGTALVAVSGPAIEDARTDVANARVESALERLDAEGKRLLARSDPTGPVAPGGRRVVTVTLPDGSLPGRRLEWLVVAADGTVRWRVAGASNRSLRPASPLVGAEGGVRITGGGRRRVRLALIERDGTPVVAVSDPGFKSERGTTATHGSAVLPSRRGDRTRLRG